MRIPIAWILRPVGTASSTSRVITVCVVTLWTSTIGVEPATVIVSSTAPTAIWGLTVAVKPAVNSMPSRMMVRKPGSENVTL